MHVAFGSYNRFSIMVLLYGIMNKVDLGNSHSAIDESDHYLVKNVNLSFLGVSILLYGLLLLVVC